MYHSLSRHRGVSLLEVLVAVAILAVLFMAMFITMQQSLLTSENSRLNTRLQKFVQQIMEEISADVYTNIPNWNNKTINYQGLTANIIVNDFAVDIKQITVYATVQGREQPVLLVSTLRAKS